MDASNDPIHTLKLLHSGLVAHAQTGADKDVVLACLNIIDRVLTAHERKPTRVEELRDQYGGPDPDEDPEWWFDTSNFDGDPVELF